VSLSVARENKIIDKRKNADEIFGKLKKAGFEAYFVGGCVRD